VLLLFVKSVCSQSQDSLLTKVNLSKSYILDLKTGNYTLDSKSINHSKNNLLLSYYNKTSQLNDVYLLNNEHSIYFKSIPIFENKFRGHKIDAFNPYGTSNIGSSIIVGLLNTVIK